jgi:hypothetical protein
MAEMSATNLNSVSTGLFYQHYLVQVLENLTDLGQDHCVNIHHFYSSYAYQKTEDPGYGVLAIPSKAGVLQ